MAQRNMNNRASRSAYNYDNDRPYALQNRGERPQAQPRQTPPRQAQPRQARPGQPQPVQNVPRQNAGRGMANGNMRPNVRGNESNRSQQNGRNGARPQRPQDPRNSSSRPVQKRPSQQAQKNGGWVYPEGYRPPQQKRPASRAGAQRGGRPSERPSGRPSGGNRRPDERRGARRQPQRRPAQKKPIITVDWQRVGVILFAVFGRFMICLCAVCIVMGIIYRNMFYSTHEPPAEEVTYSFVTVEGEGDDATTVTDTLTFDASYAYSGDELMISFSEVSKWLGTAQIGDVHSMRFVLGNGTDTSEDVVFHYNSQNAFINGAPIVMKSVARFDNGEIWVPLSFVSDYITGIEIVQETGSVILSFTGEEVSFILRPSQALTPAEQPEE